MPSFGVGTMYSPTGNSLEGITTPEYNATVGGYFCFDYNFSAFPDCCLSKE